MADDKKDVSLNDLEKDLDKGNARVQEYLEQQAVQQGAFVKGNSDSSQNDPKKSKPNTETALEVAEGAVKDSK